MMNDSKKKLNECTCDQCIEACRNKPGWFMPSQVKAIEKHFNKSLKEMLGKELAVDWYEMMDGNIMVIAPNIKGNDEIYYPGDPKGLCVLLKEDRCSIHSIKPYECAEASCCNRDDVNKRHQTVADEWKKNSHVLEEFKDDVHFEEAPFGWGFL